MCYHAYLRILFFHISECQPGVSLLCDRTFAGEMQFTPDGDPRRSKVQMTQKANLVNKGFSLELLTGVGLTGYLQDDSKTAALLRPTSA